MPPKKKSKALATTIRNSIAIAPSTSIQGRDNITTAPATTLRDDVPTTPVTPTIPITPLTPVGLQATFQTPVATSPATMMSPSRFNVSFANVIDVDAIEERSDDVTRILGGYSIRAEDAPHMTIKLTINQQDLQKTIQRRSGFVPVQHVLHLDEQKQMLQRNVDTLSAELVAAKTNCGKLTIQLEQSKEQVEGLDKTLKNRQIAQKNQTELTKQLIESKTRLQTQDKTIKNLQTSLEVEREGVAAANAQVFFKEAELAMVEAESRKNVESLRQSITEKDASIHAIKEERVQLQGDLDLARQERDQHVQENQALRDAHNTALTQLEAKHSKEVAFLQDSLKNCQNALTEKTTQVATLQIKHHTDQQAFNKATRETQDMCDMHSKALTDLKAAHVEETVRLENDLKTCQEALNDKTKELANLQAKHNTQEGELIRANERRSEENKRYVCGNQENKKLRGIISRLERERDDSNAEKQILMGHNMQIAQTNYRLLLERDGAMLNIDPLLQESIRQAADKVLASRGEVTAPLPGDPSESSISSMTSTTTATTTSSPGWHSAQTSPRSGKRKRDDAADGHAGRPMYPDTYRP